MGSFVFLVNSLPGPRTQPAGDFHHRPLFRSTPRVAPEGGSNRRAFLRQAIASRPDRLFLQLRSFLFPQVIFTMGQGVRNANLPLIARVCGFGECYRTSTFHARSVHARCQYAWPVVTGHQRTRTNDESPKSSVALMIRLIGSPSQCISQHLPPLQSAPRRESHCLTAPKTKNSRKVLSKAMQSDSSPDRCDLPPNGGRAMICLNEQATALCQSRSSKVSTKKRQSPRLERAGGST
jgi:hypothetical protein